MRTGFFISREGHVITVADVVNEAQAIWIVYNKIPYQAELVGVDNTTNIAIVRLLQPPANIPFLHLGEAMDVPKLSTMLLAIACTLGQEPGPLMGMVTGWHTDFVDKISFPTTFLRANIPSPLGEAGAPVFDMMGRFVGIIVIAINEMHSSFIVPARAVTHIRDDLVFSGKVAYAYLGVDLDEEAILRSDCCTIKKLIPESPAQKAGLKQGDKILEFDNVSIKTLGDFCNATFFARPGQMIVVKVQRENKDLKLPVRLGEKPTSLLNVLNCQSEAIAEKSEEKINEKVKLPIAAKSTIMEKKIETTVKKNNYWDAYLKDQ